LTGLWLGFPSNPARTRSGRACAGGPNPGFFPGRLRCGRRGRSPLMWAQCLLTERAPGVTLLIIPVQETTPCLRPRAKYRSLALGLEFPLMSCRHAQECRSATDRPTVPNVFLFPTCLSAVAPARRGRWVCHGRQGPRRAGDRRTRTGETTVSEAPGRAAPPQPIPLRAYFQEAHGRGVQGFPSGGAHGQSKRFAPRPHPPDQGSGCCGRVCGRL
jgi:hypothetical protein